MRHLAILCQQAGITQVVHSPGSRVAPLLIAFERQNEIKVTSIIDERCAAFYALGIAQQTLQVVVLICTSGTAALNYAPAIAEAYYQRVPLLILTADRPNEWIDQNDMQSIKQLGLYENYIKKSFSLPNVVTDEHDLWHSNRLVCEALNHCKYPDFGPVHINVPLQEPLYQLEEPVNNVLPKFIELPDSINFLKQSSFDKMKEVWKDSRLKWIIVGMSAPNHSLEMELLKLVEHDSTVVVLCERLANFSSSTFFYDLEGLMTVLEEKGAEALFPDLVVSLGGMVVSKKIKQFLRKNRPTHHWSIDKANKFLDTYQSLTLELPIEAVSFFQQLTQNSSPISEPNPMYVLQEKLREAKTRFLDKIPFSDLKAVELVLEQLPPNTLLQLGNSMSVRYACLLENLGNPVANYANRGVGGIDGASSTASGAATTHDSLTLLICGDLSFIYDSNALWNKVLSEKLRIVILNNSGGQIFNIIAGPSNLAEKEERFITHQSVELSSLVKAFNIDFYSCQTAKELQNILPKFLLNNHKTKILEIKTDGALSSDVYKSYFSEIKGIIK